MPIKLQLIETPDGPMTRAEAAAKYGLSINTIIGRVWKGFPPEKVVAPPLRSVKKPPKPPKPIKLKKPPKPRKRRYTPLSSEEKERRRNQRKRLWPRTGLIWTKREEFDAYMLHVKGGQTLEKVASWLLRSPVSIAARLDEKGWTNGKNRGNGW